MCNSRQATWYIYYFPTFDLENFKRKVWNFVTKKDIELFLLWNQDVLSNKQWNKLLDYIKKNVEICDIETLLETYRK